MTRRITCIILLLVSFFPAKAQFYTTGSDRGGRKWCGIEAGEYRLIYPSGLDSLASVYAAELERWQIPAGDRLGLTPNCSYRRKMPVILHTGTAYSNGAVAWTPRRMDLLAMPEAYDPDPLVWETQLVLHESRHVAQMQSCRKGVFKPLHWLIGELSEGAAAAIYSGQAIFEGDAVVAETALTDAGRGRTADFLEYYRAAFKEGDMRDWWQWRYGSQRWYSPDYYRAGYTLIAGMRTVFNAPDFMRRYYGRIEEKVLPFNNLQKTVKEFSGMAFNEAYKVIQDSLKREWNENSISRAPFMEGRQVSAKQPRFISYDGLAAADSCLYAIRHGIAEAATLVKILPDGREKGICPFASGTSALKWDGKRLWWTEYRQNPRWEMEAESQIRFMTPGGGKKTLVKGGRYFNPAPDGDRIAAVLYPEQGGSSVVVFDTDGKTLENMPLPSGIRAVEPVWCNGELYVSAVTEDGFGIVRARDAFSVMKAEQVKINHLFSRKGMIYYTCDRNGVNELYSVSPESGTVMQITSTDAGADEFQFLGDSLYYTSLDRDGRQVYGIAEENLRPRPAGKLYRSPMAEKLSMQTEAQTAGTTATGTPSKYSKLANLFRVHSWAPLFIDYDEIMDMSMESLSQSVGVGATVFFQNSLGDMYGSAACSAWTADGGWGNTGHAKFVWRGWYPVIEFTGNIHQDGRLDYSLVDDPDKTGSKKLVHSESGMLADGTLKTYIPWILSSGGWVRGIIPSVKMDFTDSRFIHEDGSAANMSLLSASLRAYSMRPVPSSCVYPKFGLGIEGSYSFRPFVSDIFMPYAYAYVYGYLPGFWKTHGIKFTGLVSGYLSSRNTPTTSFSIDYALPFLPLDWSGLCPLAYVRNLEMTAHYDVGSVSSSFGGSLAARLGNIAWIPYDTRVGVTWRHNVFGLKTNNSFELLLEIDL